MKRVDHFEDLLRQFDTTSLHLNESGFAAEVRSSERVRSVYTRSEFGKEPEKGGSEDRPKPFEEFESSEGGIDGYE